MEQKNTKQWSKKKLFGYTAFVLLFFLLIIELSFRIPAYFRWSPYSTDLQIQGSPRLASDSILIWNNRPFYLEFYKESQYNELGIRMPPGEVFMPKKQESDFWVFLLGGSAMAGMGSNISGEWLDITNIFNHPISTSIDGYLEKYLAERIPDKKVKVFNAAISSTTVLQSQWNYERLKKYSPDWVISMDGVNEPKSIAPNYSVKQYLIDDWKNDPSNNKPITTYTALTRMSAFLNSAKKNFFFSRLKLRRANNKVIQDKWMNATPLELKYDTEDPTISNAVDSFLMSLDAFRDLLVKNQQQHLLLIQPHLSRRNTNKLKDLEHGVYNYYTTLLDYAPTNQYYQIMYDKATEKYSNDSTIFLMNWIHESDKWVFVDYCHFTKELNEDIAMRMGDYIISHQNN